jgi:2-oxoglutarate ferredoxin oxidoreductase subunit gamma
MKHYQKVGKIAHGTHPKDASIKVDDQGLITEIIEGIFIDEPKPELQEAINRKAQIAKTSWADTRKALQDRPHFSPGVDHISRTEVQLGGFGGQGIMSAGRIIGQAATIYDHLEACFTQSYGPEARGGAAGSQVVIDSDPIHHPHLIEAKSAIIMSQEAYTKYVPQLADGGMLLIDEGLVTPAKDHRRDINTYGIPATRLAEKLGNVRAANSVMLGFWAAIVGVISKAAMRQSLADSVPLKTIDVNMTAFDKGYERGLAVRQQV